MDEEYEKNMHGSPGDVFFCYNGIQFHLGKVFDFWIFQPIHANLHGIQIVVPSRARDRYVEIPFALGKIFNQLLKGSCLKNAMPWNSKQPFCLMDGNGETTIFHVKIWFIIQLKQPFNSWMFQVPGQYVPSLRSGNGGLFGATGCFCG